MLEEEIVKLRVAVEELTRVMSAGKIAPVQAEKKAEKPAAKAAEPEEESAVAAPSLELVQRKITDVMKAKGKTTIAKILANMGASRLADVPESKWADLLKALYAELE